MARECICKYPLRCSDWQPGLQDQPRREPSSNGPGLVCLEASTVCNIYSICTVRKYCPGTVSRRGLPASHSCTRSKLGGRSTCASSLVLESRTVAACWLLAHGSRARGHPFSGARGPGFQRCHRVTHESGGEVQYHVEERVPTYRAGTVGSRRPTEVRY